MNYIDLIHDQESKNVCIDFDGVIHNYIEYGDGTITGDVIDGARDALKHLSKNYNIIVFTAKAKPDRPLVNQKTGTELVWEWLTKEKLDKYVSEVTAEKPRALVYIDDKAIRFTNWEETLINFKNIVTNK
jgi:hypothetical protein